MLVETAVMARLVGWFIGTDMVLASALLVLSGGFAFVPASSRVEELAGRKI
jgi:hypothetical protein